MMDVLARYQAMHSAILELIPTKRQKKTHGALSPFFIVAGREKNLTNWKPRGKAFH